MRRSIVLALGFVVIPFSAPLAADGLSGPAFGLATAPNGDILVADSPVGISTYREGQASPDVHFPGISDMAPIGRGTWWVVRGAADGEQDTSGGQGLYRVSRGAAREVADLFAFEQANDPVPPPPGGGPESNPFDVASLGGDFALVADAAGNDLLKVSDEGEIDVVATFPYETVSTADLKSLLGCPESGADPCSAPSELPAQPVPTSIAVGPDGYYYVGELKGFPAPRNESRIWRIAPDASWAHCGFDPACELLFDGGFTSIIDLAFGPDGLLYVVELDENSWFAATLPSQPLAGGTISACDVSSASCSVVAAGLVLPTAITFGKDGRLWSTEFGPVPGMATVTEIH